MVISKIRGRLLGSKQDTQGKKKNDDNEIDNELKFSEFPVSSSSNTDNTADDESPVYRIDKILKW